MNGARVKGLSVTLVCMYMFISGCSNECHNSKDAAKPSGKALVIDLTDNPEYQPLLKGAPQTCGMRSGRVYLKPGEECGQHSTKANEEMLVFLSGKGTALVGEEKTAFAVGEGKICYIPPNTLHNITNTGAEPLVYIYCVAPVSPDSENHPAQQEHHH